jgi:estrone sulfotransferase
MSSYWVEQSRLQKRALPEIRIRFDDVFIVSYPKSGNTWVRFLLAHLLAPEKQISFRNIEDYVPNIYKSSRTLEEREGRRYIKTHHPCYDLYPKTVYIYRDGRDALVSYYHYATGKKVFVGSFADFIFSPFVEQFSSWKKHVSGALDFASEHPDRILMLQYEEMLRQPLACAARVTAFLELGCDERTLANAVEKSSFDQLKRVEQTFGGENLIKPLTFFRSGKSGQWHEYFTSEVYERYMQENGAILRRVGYQP